MNLPTNLDSKQILFHLNYMGYQNVSKEQLKHFLTDLKKLIKYENNLQSEVQIQAGHANVNIRRLFESQNLTTPKQKTSPVVHYQEDQIQSEHLQKPSENIVQNKKPILNLRNRKFQNIQQSNDTEITTTKRITPENNHKPQIETPKHADQIIDGKSKPDKDKIPISHQRHHKPKGFIRPRSSSQTKKLKNNKCDPVALYQAYQKDWARFRSNMCESSHNELRWSIREKMLRNRPA